MSYAKLELQFKIIADSKSANQRRVSVIYRLRYRKAKLTCYCPMLVDAAAERWPSRRMMPIAAHKILPRHRASSELPSRPLGAAASTPSFPRLNPIVQRRGRRVRIIRVARGVAENDGTCTSSMRLLVLKRHVLSGIFVADGETCHLTEPGIDNRRGDARKAGSVTLARHCGVQRVSSQSLKLAHSLIRPDKSQLYL